MKKYSQRYTNSSLAEMNITPMLDLAFVLLLIFIITAPFLAERADLILPSTRARRDAVDPAKVLAVAMDRNGRLELNGRSLAQDALRAELAALAAAQPGLGVVLAADRELTVQQVSSVMDIFKEAGITDVGFLMRAENAP